MPDTLSLTTGVSLGLLAGIVSGVCYLFANGYTQTREEPRPASRRRCLTRKKHHVCCECGGDTVGGVLPCICQDHDARKFESGAWFLRQVQRALTLMPWSVSSDKLEQIEEETETSESNRKTRDLQKELHNVREFLEAISAKLAGGTLEGTRVTQLYNHPAYVRMFERHHATLRGSLADLSTALRDALKCKLAACRMI